MLRTIVVSFALLIAIVAALWNPFGAAMAYAWHAIFQPSEFPGVSVPNLSFVLGVILVARAVMSGMLPNVTHPIAAGTILFLSTGVIAQVNAIQPDIGWYWVSYFVKQALVCCFFITIINSEHRLFIAVLVIGASLGAPAAKAGLMSLVSGGTRYSQGYGNIFIDSNGYALASAMIIPLLIAVVNSIPLNVPGRWIIRNGFFLTIALCAYTSVSLFSRGALLAMITIALTYIALRNRGRIKTLAAIVIISMGAMNFIEMPKGYMDRMETITTYKEVDDKSALSRLHFWEVAVKMAQDHPLGVGMFQYADNYDQYDSSNGYYGRQRSVHSSHFQVLAEQGFVGFFVWVSLFIYALHVCFRVRTNAQTHFKNLPTGIRLESIAVGLMASMLAFIVGGSFIAAALNDLTWFVFALVGALDRLERQLITV